MPLTDIWAGWVWSVAGTDRRGGRLLQMLTPFDRFAFADQIHGSRIAVVGGRSASELQCDGFVTQSLGIALTVRTADCLPILAYDPTARVVGVAHAGWRGLVAGVETELLARMLQCGATSTSVRFLFGPSAKSCCYQVEKPGESAGSVRKAFGGDFDQLFIERDGSTYLDLPGVAQSTLVKAGVDLSHITVDQRCTIHDRTDFPSYRRDPQFAANHSMLGVIGMVLSSTEQNPDPGSGLPIANDRIL